MFESAVISEALIVIEAFYKAFLSGLPSFVVHPGRLGMTSDIRRHSTLVNLNLLPFLGALNAKVDSYIFDALVQFV